MEEAIQRLWVRVPPESCAFKDADVQRGASNQKSAWILTPRTAEPNLPEMMTGKSEQRVEFL